MGSGPGCRQRKVIMTMTINPDPSDRGSIVVPRAYHKGFVQS